MNVQNRIPMNQGLFVRDPESTILGKNILANSIVLINELGFEGFTFKKLAARIPTTEASIYRYFENKHLLLLYLVDWYWSWLQYRLAFHINNLEDPSHKLKIMLRFLASEAKKDASLPHIDLEALNEIVVSEGAKVYLTHDVAEYNKARLFKPFKDLCGLVAGLIRDYNPSYRYPRTLASTLLEMAHSHTYFMRYLPSLTDFQDSKDGGEILVFLEELLFSAISTQASKQVDKKRPVKKKKPKKKPGRNAGS